MADESKYNYPLPFPTFEMEKKKPGRFELEQKFSTLTMCQLIIVNFLNLTDKLVKPYD
jgi:hypothetical protein